MIVRLDFTDENSPLVTAQEKGMPRPARDERTASSGRREAGSCRRPHPSRRAGRFATQGLTPDKFRGSLLRAVHSGKLSPARRWQALTTAPARLFGVEGQLGSIAKGKAAHLIVTDGDFFESKTRVRHIFADGVRFDHDSGPKAPAARPATPGEEGTRPRRPAEGPAERRPPQDLGAVFADEEKDKPAAKKAKGKADDPTKDDPASEIEADRKPAVRTGGNVLLRGATVLPVSGPAAAEHRHPRAKGKISAVGKDRRRPTA